MIIIINLLYITIGILISVFIKVFIDPELVSTDEDKYIIIFGWIIAIPIYCTIVLIKKIPTIVDYFSDKLVEFLKEIKKWILS